ncbi:MAG: hypothetical protein ACRDPY_28860 [Streptosporangiaceae bacterium]
MTWMWMNVPLMVMFFTLAVGIPTWLVLKHPDRKPTLAAAPAVRTLPSRDDAPYRRAA